MATLEEGLALRRLNPALGPWATIHHVLVMARVAVDTGQRELADELTQEAATILDAYGSGMPVMRARLAAVQGLVRLERTAEVGEPLTGRERDVLRLLQGPLSLGEIARELHLSFNTVKTHTQAVYRKLGAHSRPEAVAIGRRTGRHLTTSAPAAAAARRRCRRTVRNTTARATVVTSPEMMNDANGYSPRASPILYASTQV